MAFHSFRNLKCFDPASQSLNHVLAKAKFCNSLIDVCQRIATGRDLGYRLRNPGDPQGKRLVTREAERRLSLRRGVDDGEGPKPVHGQLLGRVRFRHVLNANNFQQFVVPFAASPTGLTAQKTVANYRTVDQ